MSEWSSYRPVDFLMFAPRTYWRLFELHNEAWWPAQPLLVLVGLAWLAWGPRRGLAALRAGAAGLAAAWAFVRGRQGRSLWPVLTFTTILLAVQIIEMVMPGDGPGDAAGVGGAALAVYLVLALIAFALDRPRKVT